MLLSADNLAPNLTIASYATNNTVPLVYGWVNSPNRRGTLDILQACIATVFLCTYTVLFLNIQLDCETRTSYILYKTKWVMFTIFCPELTMAIAAEQWRSSRQSVEDFDRLRRQLAESEKISQPNNSAGSSASSSATLRNLQHAPWTAKHAFFADMGGFQLHCPDFLAFPINSYQLFWLVEQGHMDYPCLSEKTIMDKNKADTLARIVTLIQITWFTVQSIARGIQNLGITTLELSTLAFVFCTFSAFWFWRHKPLDVEEPIVIPCDKLLGAIISEAGPMTEKEWRFSRTPLDFLDPGPRLSYVATFFWGVQRVFFQDNKAPPFPVTSFSNISTIPPRGLKICDVSFATVFTAIYLGIHLAAWDFIFPTRVESILWRTAALMLLTAVVLFLIGCWPLILIGQYIFPGNPKTAIEMAKTVPIWCSRLATALVIVVFFFARSYIIVEGFVSLRALPAKAYEEVNWWKFVPYF